MRIPVCVRQEQFDIDKLEPELQTIRKAFCDYLSSVRTKNTTSKHALMGPIGKILRELRSGRRDPASLKGYALRVQEGMDVKPRLQAIQALELGIDKLVTIIASAPLAYHERILDRVDYGTYFDLRKHQLVSKEQKLHLWIKFLKDKYGSEAKLSDAWGEKVSFDRLYLERKSGGSSQRQRDVNSFWESLGSDVLEEEEIQ